MARGTTLLALLDMLRDELGRSTNVGIGIDDAGQLKRHINRGYAMCYDAYDWPHLRVVVPRFTLDAGQRLYDFPNEVSYERTVSITAYMANMPYPLTKGVSYEQYAFLDSENDVRSDPALRWDIRWSGTAPQIEIWPIPASSDQTLEIVGLAPKPRLVSDEDVCLLDDDLVVLAASIRPLARQDAKDGKVAAAEFQDRMAQMKKRAAPGARVIVGGGQHRSSSKGIILSVTGRS